MTRLTFNRHDLRLDHKRGLRDGLLEDTILGWERHDTRDLLRADDHKLSVVAAWGGRGLRSPRPPVTAAVGGGHPALGTGTNGGLGWSACRMERGRE